MNSAELFLIAMAIIFAVPYLIWRLGRTDYYAPLVVVQILTGILLGPGILGAAYPAYYLTIFTPAVVTALNGVAWWAVMIFVWIAGIELDLKAAWAQRRECGATAALALGVPLLFGCAAAVGMLAWRDGWLGSQGTNTQFVLGVGMACAVTALPILILFLEKLGVLREPLGKRVLRYASLDDVMIWAVLALILLDFDRVGKQAIFLALLVPVSIGYRALMRRIPESDRWYIGLVWLAVCAYGADVSGLHFMVGAFLAGAVTDSEWFNQEHMDLLRRHVLLTVMPVFFLSTGLRTNWSIGGASVFIAAAVLLVASVAGKLAGVGIAGKLLGWARGDIWIVGWLLQTKALIMIIFVNVLLDRHLISSETFTALLLMAVGSTMLTIPMVAPKLAGAKAAAQALPMM
ncbi:cation:proton antiporter [Pinirhizobacter sp.]|jgi:Kef-type K+ transport system membrane component KefB|uniref:cation:proton antiporter n=1 Tax=Pinirhizobacter sp. TaxID=2950432 RepID=UPI002F42363F